MFDLCPCHSGKTLASCCLPFIEGKVLPSSALELMRSRFAAFALGRAEYIMQTTHQQNRQYQKNRAKWKKEIETFSITMDFVGLIIHAHEQTGDRARVEFTAQLVSSEGVDCSFRETSQFVQEDGRWLYLEGQT